MVLLPVPGHELSSSRDVSTGYGHKIKQIGKDSVSSGYCLGQVAS